LHIGQTRLGLVPFDEETISPFSCEYDEARDAVLGDGERSRVLETTVRFGTVVPNTLPPPAFGLVKDDVEPAGLLTPRCAADDDGMEGRGFCCGRFIEFEEVERYSTRCGRKGGGEVVGFGLLQGRGGLPSHGMRLAANKGVTKPTTMRDECKRLTWE
jgi:hypothetical protein